MNSPNSVRGAVPSARLLPTGLAPAAIALFVLCGIGPNSLLALAAIVVFVIGSSLLQRPGESPVLLFIFGYQWLQASVAIFHANWFDVTVSEVSVYSRTHNGDVDLATILSLVGLLALALGMRVGAGPWRREVAALTVNVASRYETKRWFYLYVAAWLVATMALSVAWIYPGLSQILIILAKLKWAFFYMLAYVSFVKPNANRTYCLLAFGIELLSSLGSYFSDFKTVFIFTMLAVVAAALRPTARQFIGLSGLAAAVLAFAVVWTAIKTEYRSIVRGAEADQVVTIGFFDRLETLVDLVSQLNGEQLAASVDFLLKRVAYVDFFGMVLETVPESVPHEGGALWGDALSRPFMPRLLFPEKSAIDDTERTNQYTLLSVAGAEKGTSMSLGYMAESYIDFGEVGMMLPIFLLGLMLGRIYRWMSAHRGILGMGLGTAICFSAAFLETSITKSFGSLILTILLSWLIMRFAAPRYFPWALASS